MAVFRILLLSLPLVFGLWTNHGAALRSGLDLAPGDAGDARIMVFLIESGWRALAGEGDLRSPPMFFPQAGTRAYTDGHLLWLPLHGALRGMGLGMIQAFSALFLVLLAAGYAGALLMLRRVLGLGAAAAALGAYFFAFSNALTLKLGHGQMIGAMLLPWVVLLIHRGWARGSPWAPAVGGVLVGLLAATSYIVAWFFLFFAGVAALIGAACLAPMRAALRRRAAWVMPGGFAAGLALGLVPFLILYVPQIIGGPRRNWRDVMFYRPLGSDLLNLADFHPVWGRALAWLGIPHFDPETIAERMMGFSPPIWALAVAGIAVLLLRGWRHLAVPQRALVLTGAAVAVGILLQFRYGGLVWPWFVVLKAVPGASAIRTTFRSQIIALLPVAGLLAVAAQAAMARAPAGVARGVVFAVLAVLVGADGWGRAPDHSVSGRAEQALVAGVPAPPAGCVAFALAPQPGRQWYAQQSDALMLALHWHLPTMNGNSSWLPPGWAFRVPEAPGYAAGVRAWATQTGIAERACIYDVGARRFEMLADWTGG